MLTPELQSLLSSPEAMVDHVYKRLDFAGVIKRNRLFVIQAIAPGPPKHKVLNVGEQPDETPRIWVFGYTLWEGEDRTFGRPYAMLLDSLLDTRRYQPTDMLIDSATGKSKTMNVTVVTNDQAPKSPKRRVAVTHEKLHA